MKIAYLFGFVSLLSAAACAAPTSEEHHTATTAAGEQKGAEPSDPAAPGTVTGTPGAASDRKPSTNPVAGCTPLAAGAGGGNPADGYCVALGYSLDAKGDCAFPDGTTCEPWSFWRGQCGGEHSFCALHGGTVSSKEENMGTWTAVYAVCSFADGRSCHDSDFATSCSCQ